MRRTDREVLEQEQIEAIIHKCRVCRLGFADQGKPYVVPLNFGYRDGVLYFHSADRGKKVDLLKTCPEVWFEMDRIIRMVTGPAACEWGVQYESVMGSGTARIIEGRDEKRTALDIIMAHYSKKTYAYDSRDIDKTVVFTVTVRQMTGKANRG